MISINFLAYLIESVKSLIEIERRKLSVSKFTKDDSLLSGTPLNSVSGVLPLVKTCC